MIPEIWFDPKTAARLTGCSKKRLAEMAASGAIKAQFGADGIPVAYAEADVTKLRRKRGRIGAEREKEARKAPKKTSMLDGSRRETRLRERPGDQKVLPWSPFPSGNPRD